MLYIKCSNEDLTSMWLFLTVSRGCLQFVIVVFPDHTHLLFLVLITYWQKPALIVHADAVVPAVLILVYIYT